MVAFFLVIQLLTDGGGVFQVDFLEPKCKPLNTRRFFPNTLIDEVMFVEGVLWISTRSVLTVEQTD